MVGFCWNKVYTIKTHDGVGLLRLDLDNQNQVVVEIFNKNGIECFVVRLTLNSRVIGELGCRCSGVQLIDDLNPVYVDGIS